MQSIKTSVLIVDDDEDVRRLLGRQVSSIGHDVVVVDSGEEALTIVSDQEFDLIFIDHMMPGLSGYDTIHQLRAKGCKSKIVVITASKEDQIFDQFLDSDLAIDGFLNKPFDLGQVERCLETILSRGGKFLSPS